MIMAGTRQKNRTARHPPQPQQPGIRAFGKVSKSIQHADGAGKTVNTGNNALKRRIPTPDPEEGLHNQSSTKRQRLNSPSVRTPKKSEKTIQYLLTPESSPEKDCLSRSVKQATISAAHQIRFTSPYSSPSTPNQTDSESLPEPAQDFIRLYTSLLKALSLHYAHNGISSPADVRQIASSTSSIWGKRAVKLDDICRCFGVYDAEFDIIDYGRGKTCIERKETKTRGVVPQPLEEEKLEKSFMTRLRDLWRDHQKVAQDTDKDGTESVDVFLNNLPQTKVAVTPTLEKVAPIFSLGKRRLKEFQSSQAQANNVIEPSTPSHSRTTPSSSPQSSHSTASALFSQPSTPTPRRVTSPKLKASGSSVANRQSTLLARLSEKHTRTAAERALKKELTKTDLERRAALHRLPDIATMLPMPRAGKTRSTYALPELIQQIRDSSRTPLGKEEVETCLQVMGEESMGSGWVKIVETLSGATGTVAGIVVDHGKRVDSTTLKDRINLELEKI